MAPSVATPGAGNDQANAVPMQDVSMDDGGESLFDALLSGEEGFQDEEPEDEETTGASAPAGDPDPDGDSEDDADDEGTDEEQDEEQDDELSDDDAEPSDPKSSPAKDISQELVTVKPDGIEEQVTVAEAAAGYMRTKDYTKKTMAVAEERKAVQAEKEAYAEVVSQYRKALDNILTPENAPDEALKETDPAAYAVQVLEWQQLEKARNDAKAAEDRVLKEREQKALAERQEVIEQEYQKVIAAVPAWKDQKVASRELRVIRQGALSMGFTEEDLSNLYYAPAILALRKAVLYDRQREKARTVAKPAVTKGGTPSKPSTLKPGASVTQGRKPNKGKAAERLKSSGSLEDFAEVLLESGQLDNIPK